MDRLTIADWNKVHGRPNFLKGESELFLEQEVFLYNGDEKYFTSSSGTRARITTHRLILSWESNAYQLPLSLIQSHILKKGFLARHPKIALKLDSTTTPGPLPHSPDGIMLSFHDGGHKRFNETLSGALLDRAWAIKQAMERPKLGAQAYGLAALTSHEAKRTKQQGQFLSGSFSDLDALRQNAMRLVRLAEQLKASKGKSEEETEAQGLVADFGMAATVSRDTHGDRFIEEMAREMSVFLIGRLERAPAGMIALAEAYAMYNRHRGTNLVSPKDFQEALAAAGRFGLPIQTKFLGSGLQVLALSSSSSKEVGDKLIASLEHMTADRRERGVRTLPFLTPFDVSQLSGVSITLAADILVELEHQCRLCRDISAGGLVFYRNYFIN
eukprot:gnl/Dysnectes_brevis/3375_a4246_893.p1 GENE.gnl/Dysnectes_brevis/3375_a4246_893~~gnl/Dysnectes_brevis/3375_a4246_893.p1  ORF type:complete len:385 (+),score=13.25 gnl/Dysnectes_brevis/3375_a4246_893:122-1276(+)